MKKENTIPEAEMTAPKLKETKYETPFGGILTEKQKAFSEYEEFIKEDKETK
jgi:hypothetical protein